MAHCSRRDLLCCSIELCLSEFCPLELVVKYQDTIAVDFVKESEIIYKSHCISRGAKPLEKLSAQIHSQLKK